MKLIQLHRLGVVTICKPSSHMHHTAHGELRSIGILHNISLGRRLANRESITQLFASMAWQTSVNGDDWSAGCAKGWPRRLVAPLLQSGAWLASRH
jgi:hypothetical protein